MISRMPRVIWKVGRTALLHVNGMKDVEPGCSSTAIVVLFVNEDKKRVAQPENLLPRILVRAGGLWLPDTGHFQVDGQSWQIDPAGRASRRVNVSLLQVRL